MQAVLIGAAEQARVGFAVRACAQASDSRARLAIFALVVPAPTRPRRVGMSAAAQRLVPPSHAWQSL